jgi:ATP-dependent DNA ligase
LFFKSSGDVPLIYYAFDLPFLEGKDLRKQTFRARRKLFSNLLKKPPQISGSLTSFAAAKTNCSGLLKNSASRG